MSFNEFLTTCTYTPFEDIEDFREFIELNDLSNEYLSEQEWLEWYDEFFGT